jgi:predicted acetyltransferase
MARTPVAGTEIRAITGEERAAFFDLLRYSFRTWTSQPPAEEDLAGIVPEQTLGLFVGGRLASALRIHRFVQSVRGTLRKMGGVAGVASYPEHRGRGHVSRLLESAFAHMREHEQPVSMLHPFRESFYQRYGYVAATTPLEIEIPTHAFVHYLDRNAEPDLTVERLRPLEARPAYEAFLREMARGINGFVLHDGLPDRQWLALYRDWLYLLVKRADAVVAAARYEKRGEKLNRGTLHFRELFWRDSSGRDALFRFIAAHRDNAESVILEVPPDAPVQSWVHDAMSPFRLAMDEKPWMPRIIDVRGALAGLPVSGDGRVLVRIADERCPWNAGLFRLEAGDGRLAVAPGTGEPAASLDIRALSSLLYGCLDCAELARRGWMSGDGALLDRWFPTAPFFCSLRF